MDGTLPEEGRRPRTADNERDGEVGDLPVVARKRANKAASAAAEPVERRGGAKEEMRICKLARSGRRGSGSRVTGAGPHTRSRHQEQAGQADGAFVHHINIDVLRASFSDLKKTAAPGVDEVTWTEYAKRLETNLLDLHARVHTGAYRAPVAVAPEVYTEGGRQTATVSSASPP